LPELNWPTETAGPFEAGSPRLAQPRSNICLDFHGDPLRARLVVVSDGNHHMALREVLALFLAQNPAVDDIFYSTTPPGLALQWLAAGHVDVGNLRLSVRPHVMIAPPAALEQAVAGGHVTTHQAFMRSRGTALLVRKGNPQGIRGAADLLRDGVTIFLSNPLTEKVSYAIYRSALQRLAAAEGCWFGFLEHEPGLHHSAKLCYGDAIHHREAPQALADGRADVAVVFHHLALRYQRIFAELFDVVRPGAWVQDEEADIGRTDCGPVGDGGAWGTALLDFLATEDVTRIYRSHGLERCGPR
jgi:hypothetical protein